MPLNSAAIKNEVCRYMRISPVSLSNFGARNELKGVIYVKPVKNGATQEGIINAALNELKGVSYDPTDILYMNSMGIYPAFSNGSEAVNYLKSKGIPIQYGKFSDKKVHACLGRDETGQNAVLINSRYKDSTSQAEILATAEAIVHEAGHAKDEDKMNSIQEELDNLGLNVLTHRAFEKKYQGVFDGCDSFLFKEGVSLYPQLFFEYGADKTSLKDRVADKFGHLPAGDNKHPASKLANEIKELGELE